MASQLAPGSHSSWGEVFRVFLRLGLTSFGGPIAHLGYFRTEFVEHRKWLDEKTYADLVALSQFLPGPASSKVGIAVGFFRAGYAGALIAWAGFTLPSAIALVLFAYRHRDVRRCARQRVAARAEGGRGGGGGASRARHDALARARPRAGDRRCHRGGDRSRRSQPPGARSGRSFSASSPGSPFFMSMLRPITFRCR